MKITEKDFNALTTKCYEEKYKYGDWMIHSLDGAIVIAYRELSRRELAKLFPER